MSYYDYQFGAYSKKSLVTVEEYQGEEEFSLNCTQLSELDFPKQSQRRKVVDDWVEFFQNNPTVIKKLAVVSRMNQKLFNGICCQENLEELSIKWGMYPDLTAIKQLKKLNYLSLASGASTKDISPIGELVKLEVLRLSTVGATDYSSLAKLTQLKLLCLHSGMDNLIKVDSLAFLSHLRELRNLRTTGFRLLNHDYSPVLTLNQLEFLSINMPTADCVIWNERFAEHFSEIPENRHRTYLP